MSKAELFDIAFGYLIRPQTHPVQIALMEEICETILESNANIRDLSELVVPAKEAFISSNSQLQGFLVSMFRESRPDTMTLNYGNKSYTFKADDPYLNNYPTSVVKQE